MKSSFALGLILSSQFAFALGPRPGEVEITGLSIGGNGCPQNSVDVVLAPDAKSFTVLYDQFYVEVAPGRSKQSAKCQVELDFKKPRAMGFTIEAVDFRGFVHLEPGATAEQKVSAGISASSRIRQATSDFGYQRWSGPVSENFILSTVRPFKTPEILNCLPAKKSTTLVLKSELKINQRHPASSGLLTVDSTDGRMAQRYHMRWVNCAKAIGGIIGGLFR